MKYIALFIFIIFSSCGFSQNDSFSLVKEFYEKAKEREKELTVFYNIKVQARGIDPIDSTYRITRIEYKVNDSLSLTLPGIKEYMSDEELETLPFYENIEVYGQVYGITKSQALAKVKEICKEVFNLMFDLKAYKVNGSIVNEPSIIVFGVTAEYDVVYVPLLFEVVSSYWQSFFTRDNKFDSKWYYRKN